MKQRRRRGWARVLMISGVILLCPGLVHPKRRHRLPLPLYLTWSSPDTSSTITVNYHTGKRFIESEVYFDTEPKQSVPSQYRYRAMGRVTKIPGAKRWVHKVELTQLEPGACYYFIAGDSVSGFTEEKRFCTVPDDGSAIRLAVGGDVSGYPSAIRMARKVALYDPDAVLLGGDIAYSNGKSFALWDGLLRRLGEALVTQDGRTIPLVLAIGNHETGGRPYFQRLFDQGESIYFALDLGPDCVLFVLDSGHTIAHAGKQSRWLRASMQEHEAYPVKLALYHEPLYPARNSFDQSGSKAGRKAWLPLFDRFGLTAAFENDDHVYKRSKLLTANEVAENGTLYIGGGSWGVAPKQARKAWYLARSRSVGSALIVDVGRDEVEYRALRRDGKVIDDFVQVVGE